MAAKKRRLKRKRTVKRRYAAGHKRAKTPYLKKGSNAAKAWGREMTQARKARRAYNRLGNGKKKKKNTGSNYYTTPIRKRNYDK